MADYIFLNPSPNLLKVADCLKYAGKSIRIASDSQFPMITSANMHIFCDGTYKTARKTSNPQEIPSEYCKAMKKNILNFMYGRKIANDLTKMGDGFEQGNITDICLIKTSGIYSHTIKSQAYEQLSHQTILNEFPNSFIVTGCMESISGNEKMQMFDTDFNLKESFGSDYFLLFTKKDRLEICTHGNRLITIGSKNADHMEILTSAFPMLRTFSFKRVKELIIARNRNPWAYKVIDKRIILINDYSYFNLSLKLLDVWYEKAGKLLCSEKLR